MIQRGSLRNGNQDGWDPRKNERVKCHLAGCQQLTTGKKPFCTLHVLRMQYAGQVLAKLNGAR